MNKKFLIAWLAVFVAWMAGSFVLHGALLKSGYSNLPNLYRTEEDTAALTHFMLLAHIVMAGAFVWIYARGAEDKPWLPQGLRFGAAIALLCPIPMYLIYYVVQPMPVNLVAGQMIGETVLVLALGALVAFFYREPVASA